MAVYFELNRESRIPLYMQLVTQVREMIARGALKSGDRLPANRELARSLNVNRNTVTTAYSELEADGLIQSHVGRGTFIASLAPRIKTEPITRTEPSPMVWSALMTTNQRDRWLNGLLRSDQPPGTISLAHGLPQADLFPLDDFRRSVDRVLRKEGRELLQLGLTGGYRPLQQYLCLQMELSGIKAAPDEILITNGCQQSLDLLRRVFVEPGDEVAIENPTYPGAISVFCGNNARYVSVPVREAGMDLDALEDILSQRRPKLIYTIPTFHNPTGARMDIESRRRLLDLATRHRVPIIEDDIYSELHYDGPTLPSLKAMDEHGVVISINSFSKVGFPGLRVGWIVAPRVVNEQLNIAKQNADLHASMLTQAAIFEFSRRGLLAKHVKRVRRAYAERRDAMLDALERYFPADTQWNKPAGGMAVWVRLPEQLNSTEVLHRAAERGVVFSPGDHFYSAAPRHNMMRLCFTIASPEKIEEGIKRLGSVVKERITSIRKQRAQRAPEAMRALV
jgi:GntR family transcriptional regulator/MocR family aminotransferase